MVIKLAKVLLGKVALAKVRLAKVDFSGGRVKGPDYNDDFNEDYFVAVEETETE